MKEITPGVAKTSDASGLYIVRLLIVTFALPVIPAAPFVFFDKVPESLRWVFLAWLPVGLIFWGIFSRHLLVSRPYTCPNCGVRKMTVEIVEKDEIGEVYFTCPTCGLRDKSDDVQLGT